MKSNIILMLNNLSQHSPTSFQVEANINKKAVLKTLELVKLLDSKYFNDSNISFDTDSNIVLNFKNAKLILNENYYTYEANLAGYQYIRKGINDDLSKIVDHITNTVL